jgi:hypothetical protein
MITVPRWQWLEYKGVFLTTWSWFMDHLHRGIVEISKKEIYRCTRVDEVKTYEEPKP